MERKPVQSSNLRSIGYDETTSTLEIEFKANTVYKYFDVSKQIYEALMSASSKGNFFHQFIKDKYRFVKVN